MDYFRDILNPPSAIGFGTPEWLRLLLMPQFALAEPATMTYAPQLPTGISPSAINFGDIRAPSYLDRIIELGRPTEFKPSFGTRPEELTREFISEYESRLADISELIKEAEREFEKPLPEYRGAGVSPLEIILAGLAFATSKPEDAAGAVAAYYGTKEARERQKFEDTLRREEERRKLQLAKYGRLGSLESETMRSIAGAKERMIDTSLAMESAKMQAELENVRAANEWKKTGMLISADDIARVGNDLRNRIKSIQDLMREETDPEIIAKHAVALQQAENEYMTLYEPNLTPDEKLRRFEAKYGSDLMRIAAAPSVQTRLAESEIRRSETMIKTALAENARAEDLHELQKEQIRAVLKNYDIEWQLKKQELDFTIKTLGEREKALYLDNQLKQAQIKLANANAKYISSGGKSSSSPDAMGALRSMINAARDVGLLGNAAYEQLNAIYIQADPKKKDAAVGRSLLEEYSRNPNAKTWTARQQQLYPALVQQMRTLKSIVNNSNRIVGGDALSGSPGFLDIISLGSERLFGPMPSTQKSESAPRPKEPIRIPGDANAVILEP